MSFTQGCLSFSDANRSNVRSVLSCGLKCLWTLTAGVAGKRKEKKGEKEKRKKKELVRPLGELIRYAVSIGFEKCFLFNTKLGTGYQYCGKQVLGLGLEILTVVNPCPSSEVQLANCSCGPNDEEKC